MAIFRTESSMQTNGVNYPFLYSYYPVVLGRAREFVACRWDHDPDDGFPVCALLGIMVSREFRQYQGLAGQPASPDRAAYD